MIEVFIYIDTLFMKYPINISDFFHWKTHEPLFFFGRRCVFK